MIKTSSNKVAATIELEVFRFQSQNVELVLFCLAWKTLHVLWNTYVLILPSFQLKRLFN